MKRTALKKTGSSPTAKIKRQIQALLRERAIERDGGCVLRHYDIAGECSGYRKDGELILQAEHLNGRARSASYAEMDNIVCLCQYHHIFFKKQNNALYWALIRKHLGEKRWKKVEAWILDQTPHRMGIADWRAAAENLTKPSK